jgi:hypothetical protein
MKSTIPGIAAVALVTLFLSARVFACGTNTSNKTDRDMPSVSDSSGRMSIDRDTGDLNQSGYDSNEPLSLPDTD